MQEDKWVMIYSQDDTIQKVVIFDNYWEGARYTENVINGIDNGFYSIVVGKCYDKNNITIGLYRAGGYYGDVCIT